MKMIKSKRPSVRRTFSRRATTAHDPWLTLNMGLFNFGGGWSQLLARQQAQQFGR